MSLDRKLDQAFDQLGDNLENQLSNFGTRVIGPFFAAISAGIREVYNKKIYKEKSFYQGAIVLIIATVIIAVLEKTYIRHLITDQPVWHWLYFRQKLMPFPVAMAILIWVPMRYFSKKGKAVVELRNKFNLAFERCGLYSRRSISKEGEKPRPEYPFLIKDVPDKDGGITFIFKNPGIPLESWLKAIPSLESTLEQRVNTLEPVKKNTGYIALKLGGSEIPDKVQYTKELVCGLKKSQVALGLDKNRTRAIHDFEKVPHLLIAGLTGSGKSVVLRFIVYQALEQQNANLWAIDFKGGIEFKSFEDLGVECVWDREKTLKVLNYLNAEHDARVELFKEEGVKNIDQLNEKGGIQLKRCYVPIDELAELTDPTGVPKNEQHLYEAIEGALSRLARLSRATGIHLVPATQRPDAKVITGQLKTNLGGRISGFMPDHQASQMVLGNASATKIENTGGRFLYSTGNRVIEFQAPYFEDKHMDKSLRVDYAEGMLISYYEYLENVSSTPSVREKNMRSKMP